MNIEKLKEQLEIQSDFVNLNALVPLKNRSDGRSYGLPVHRCPNMMCSDLETGVSRLLVTK